jgi:TetR/AcrR family transcriptional regulator, transcriptional repressor for nem operon
MKKAEATRLYILEKAFEMIYMKGYQNTSIDQILDTTDVTKGAFYYHFKTKDEMGIAIIDELLKPALASSFEKPLQRDVNPLEGIYNLMYDTLIKNQFFKVAYGCPAANLTQEMTPWNPEFSVVLNELRQQWVKVLTTLIEKGKQDGLINSRVNAKQVTMFILAGYWGARTLGRLENSKKPYLLYLKELKNYLHTLK